MHVCTRLDGGLNEESSPSTFMHRYIYITVRIEEAPREGKGVGVCESCVD